MVFLAITPQGLAEAIRLAKAEGQPVWCSAEAMPEAECVTGLSRFDYSLFGGPPDVIAGALATIAEHHPNESIWLEQVIPDNG